MPRLLTLGGLVVLGEEDRPVASIRGRNLALLALLARGGTGGMTRERLAAYLWPESETERARHSLDQALYRLRRTLGSELFIAGGPALLCNRTILDSDVQRFEERLAAADHRAAVEEYSGPFLEGFHLSDAPEFEHWVDREQRSLHQRYSQALELLARAASEHGDSAAVVDYWLRLAAEEPLSGRVTSNLVQALVEAGDRGRALEVAETHIARVAEEIGSPPDPKLDALIRELRTPASPEEPDRGTASPRAPLPGGPPEPLVRTPRGRHTSPRLLYWAGPLALAVVVLLSTVVSRWAGTPPAGLPTVAVRAFENRTGDAEFDPLAGLVSDWVSAGLSQTGLVQVVREGRAVVSSTERIEGRIYRVGDSLRAEIQILGEDGTVRTGLQPVSAAAASPSELLEPLREAVLGAVASLHDPRIRDWSGSALRPPDYAAYRHFAAGMELHAVPRDLVGAADRFARAAELDPDYVIPQLWLSWSLIMMERYAEADSVAAALTARRNGMTPLERAWHDRIRALLAGDMEESYQAAVRMVEAAPGSAWTLSLANAAIDARRPEVAVRALRETGIAKLGLQREHGWTVLTDAYHRLGDYERELEASDAAIRSDGLGWGMGGPGVRALAALGRVDDLEARLERIQHLPPIHRLPQGPSTRLVAVTELRAHGHAGAASALADRLLARSPEASDLDSVSRLLTAELFYELGRWSEARDLLADVRTEEGGLRARRLRGLLLARAGDTVAARRVAVELAADLQPYGFGVAALGSARIRAVLGEQDEALRLLRRAFAEGANRESWQEAHVTRDFDRLRARPLFQRILQPH